MAEELSYPSPGELQGRTTYSQVAESLLDIGFWPVPLETDNPKKPAVRYREVARRGLTRREVGRWVRQFPDCNVGTIVPPTLACADFDAEPPAGLHLPCSPVAVTRRGEHRWFRVDRPIRTRKLTTAGGVYGDIKGAGSVVVLPPSLIKGHLYEWADYLSPSDVPFAPAPEWVGGQETRNRNKAEDISVSFLSCKSLFPSPGDLLSFSRRPEVERALLTFLSIPLSAAEGGSFLCVLPGHGEQKPSASLFVTERGNLVYRDWHARDGREWFTLPEVFASQMHGRAVSLGGAEEWSDFVQIIWQARLLIESGALRIPRPSLPLPDDAPEVAARLADGLSLLFACRWLLNYGQPAPFSWRFAKLWCGMTETTIQQGVRCLLERKIVRTVGKARFGGREVALFLPGKATDRH